MSKLKRSKRYSDARFARKVCNVAKNRPLILLFGESSRSFVGRGRARPGEASHLRTPSHIFVHLHTPFAHLRTPSFQTLFEIFLLQFLRALSRTFAHLRSCSNGSAVRLLRASSEFPGCLNYRSLKARGHNRYLKKNILGVRTEELTESLQVVSKTVRA